MWRITRDIILILLLSAAVVFALPSVTSAQQTPQAPPDAQNIATPPEDDGTTCSIEKIGWILCPVIEGAARVGDAAFSVLANNFLQIEPALVNDDTNGTKGAWEISRNIANIMFIIAFMVIIYSQITGAGLSNYGIKRMLPRIIFAAILVNISYYICQGLVDLTNAGGFLIKEALYDIAAGINSRAAIGSGESTAGVLSAIAVAALASVAIVWMILPVLGSIVLLVLVTSIVIVIILLLRKALVVLLVVLSPIAFVAYLLPNTEKLFSKWLHMFWQLLLVFPTVALLFGAGQLASSVILAAGQNSGASSQGTSYGSENEECVTLPEVGSTEPAVTGDCGEVGSGTTSLSLGLVAAGIAVAPLLAVWAVLQGALAAAGAVGGKISGAIQRGTSKGVNGASGWAGKNTSIGRGLAARKAIKQNFKDQKFAGKMSRTGKSGRLTRIAARGVGGNLGLAADKLTDRMPDDGKLGRLKNGLNATTGSLQAQSTKLSANFAGAAAKIEAQDVNDQASLYDALLRNTRGRADSAGNRDDEQKLGKILEDAIISGDKAGAKAATNMLLQRGGPGTKALASAIDRRHGAANSNAETMAEFKSNIAQNHSSLKSSDADIYAWSTDAGGRNLTDVGADQTTYDKVNNDQMATQSTRSLNNAGASASLDGGESYVYADPTSGQSRMATRQRKAGIIASDAAKNIKAENKRFF